ncbi:MAG: ABC transporter ATP-binding protein [Promethearchaeota archaeon]|nr:MAG: ABC transporter ATP-binding protein [Candidatus Lokiarchaeota archaeon]
MIEGQEVILDVKDLTTRFYTEEGTVYAVEGISFKVYEGEVLGFVGETGCGKSVTALSILQLIQPPGKITNGVVDFIDEDLLKKSRKEILSYRGDKITMIFQDPINSLNPVFTVGKQISEVLLLHKEEELMIQSSKQNNKGLYDLLKERTLQILKDMNIPSPEKVIDRYPHELSGGMRQRIQIAMAIACSPVLLIADEPTTALDVTVQNQILKLMKNLQKNYNTSIIFITHDLSVISKMCDRVAVMYCGSIVEYGAIKTIFKKTYHPYTRGLLSAVPIGGKKEDLQAIPGMIPNPIYPPSGCKFHPRCSFCFEPCESIRPKSIEVEPNYFVSCHLYDPEYKEQVR